MTRGLGYLRDPWDERDRPLELLLGTLASSPPPVAASVDSPEVEPKDQGETSSCTGQAWAQAIRLSMLARGRRCPELSALFSYYTGRAEWGGHARGDFGSYLRTGAAAAMRFGCADERDWPFAEARVGEQPNVNAFRSAYDLRGVRGYYRIAPRPDDVRRAIAAGHPVVGGWEVDAAFVDYSGRGVLDRPDPAKFRGGHALVVTDYRSDGTFRLLNSYGHGWGRHGYAAVSEAFIAAGLDLWAVDTEGPP